MVAEMVKRRRHPQTALQLLRPPPAMTAATKPAKKALQHGRGPPVFASLQPPTPTSCFRLPLLPPSASCAIQAARGHRGRRLGAAGRQGGDGVVRPGENVIVVAAAAKGISVKATPQPRPNNLANIAVPPLTIGLGLHLTVAYADEGNKNR